MSSPLEPPEPPVALPPARTVQAPGRGELFMRDTGGDGPPVLLLHGWMASADLNWWSAYGPLSDAGYRVIALDHRGHGRGLRTVAPFRLTDCAADAAAVLRQLGAAPATVVGYSMGGVIASLLAREHPDVVSGLVLSATAQEWQGSRERYLWRGMGAIRLLLSGAPYGMWRRGLKRVGINDSPATAWLVSELLRHSARDVAEAGRQLGKFDSTPWLGEIAAPAAFVVTTRDASVPPSKQRAAAAALRAHVFEAAIDHLEVTSRPTEFNGALLAALDAVGARDRPPATAAPAEPGRITVR